MKHLVLPFALWMCITFVALSSVLYSVSAYEEHAIRVVIETHGYPPSQTHVASLMQEASTTDSFHSRTAIRWQALDDSLLLIRMRELADQRDLIAQRIWLFWTIATFLPLAIMLYFRSSWELLGSTKAVEPTGSATIRR